MQCDPIFARFIFVNCTGHVARGKTVAGCADGVWTPSLEDMSCAEGAALIAGGFDGCRRLQEVEVWTADGQRRRLSDLPLGTSLSEPEPQG